MQSRRWLTGAEILGNEERVSFSSLSFFLLRSSVSMACFSIMGPVAFAFLDSDDLFLNALSASCLVFSLIRRVSWNAFLLFSLVRLGLLCVVARMYFIASNWWPQIDEQRSAQK
jgi:hypothetical protein